MPPLRAFARAFACALALTLAPPAGAAVSADALLEDAVRVVMMPGLAESGLAKWIVDDFKATRSGIRVEVTTAGADEVFALGREGDADLLVTHHRAGEELFIAEGWGAARTLLMFGEYAFYGPPGDKLQLQGETDVRVIVRKLAQAQVPFVAASPRSAAGHRLAELLSLAGVAPTWPGFETLDKDPGDALRAAAKADAYTFVDAITFQTLKREVQANLQPVVRALPSLRDPYAVISISGERVPGVRHELAQAFLEYLVSERGQARIGSFVQRSSNATLFSPGAHGDDGLRARRAEESLKITTLELYTALALGVLAIAAAAVATTAWRRARRRVRRHQRIEERFALAVEAAGSGIWDWDLADDQVYLSRRFREIVGLETKSHWFPAPKELWTRAIHPEDLARVHRAIDDAVAEPAGGVLSVEARLRPERGAGRVAIRGNVHRRRGTRHSRIVGTIESLEPADPPAGSERAAEAAPQSPAGA
ncbi:MAG: PAS domain-containing protein [Burkholderiaceae bacterium]